MSYLHFFVRFHTSPGQSLWISGNAPAFGDLDPQAAVPMRYFNSDWWHFRISMEGDEISWPETLQYRYILQNDNGERIIEWGDDRLLPLSRITAETIILRDVWNHAGTLENVFYTAPFQEVLLNDQRAEAKPKPFRGHTHAFRVKAPLLRKHEVLCLLGSGDALGNWSVEKPVLLQKEDNWWTVKLNLTDNPFPIEYKYGVYHTREKRFLYYENGNNRILDDLREPGQFTLIHDGFAQLSVQSWRGAGVAIPVFSLRSRHSFGVGEFSDIKLLVDWAKKVHLKLIQILPVNDTTATHTWEDSYPYKAISAFAAHPLFINLEQVAGKDHPVVKGLRKKQKALNELPDVDYEEVMKHKWKALEELYADQGEETFRQEAYQQFFKDNEHWLVPYAAFSYLRDKYKTPDFSNWKTHSTYDAAAIRKLVSPSQKHYHQVAIHYYIQYHLHLQLLDAVQYAHQHGIIIKGDIPIGINRTGVDAWTEPELYNMNMQAGAPPDDFAIKGQNWGFPTYNWQRMAEDGFSWWKRRFEHMGRYFDAFRIDHILGFFRIWSIPIHAVDGVMGHFVPSVPIHAYEFSERGIHFLKERLCEPYITDALLWEMFGPANEKVRSFLESEGDGRYRLKEPFRTQRQVADYFSKLDKSEENDRLQSGLFDLLSNVLFFEVEGSHGEQYYPRIAMEQTASFRYLDPFTQQQLRELYVHYFYQRQDDNWAREAMHKLPELKAATNMLICGEDLGMVPHCVPDVMKQLGILSLEIQRMPKDSKREFFHPNDAPYLSVVTPSTHDMSTIRGWWEEDRHAIQRFFNQELGQYGQAPFYCEAWINKSILIQHLYSPAMWCIFQLQDILGMDEKIRRQNPQEERINVPANPKHYWRYRMHLSLEQLMSETSFNQELKQYVQASSRG